MLIDVSTPVVAQHESLLPEAQWEFKTNKYWIRMAESANVIIEQRWLYLQSCSNPQGGDFWFTVNASAWGDDRPNRYEIDLLAFACSGF